MITRFLIGVVPFVLVIANLVRQPAIASDDAGADSDDVAAFQEYAQGVAQSYELRIGGVDGRELRLREKPILRWTNPVDTATYLSEQCHVAGDSRFPTLTRASTP